LKKPTTVKEACRNAIDFWAKIQTDDGHWANDYGGPEFLLPGMLGSKEHDFKDTVLMLYFF